jgi:hypothetical protein
MLLSLNVVAQTGGVRLWAVPFGVSAMRDIEVWKNNPDDWEKVRIAVGEQLAR